MRQASASTTPPNYDIAVIIPKGLEMDLTSLLPFTNEPMDNTEIKHNFPTSTGPQDASKGSILAVMLEIFPEQSDSRSWAFDLKRLSLIPVSRELHLPVVSLPTPDRLK